MAVPQTADNEFQNNPKDFGVGADDSIYEPDRKNGEQAVKTVGTTLKTTGLAIQATGTGMQATGKIAKGTGSVAMKVGTALNKTRVGAVVGVPLIVVGGTTRAAGTTIDSAGKTVRKVGLKTRAAGEATTRITTGDRTQQGIRNIRTESRVSSMPGSPRNVSVDDSHPDIATSFNQEYAKKGIQPTNLNDKTDPKYSPTPEHINRSAEVTYSSRPIPIISKGTRVGKIELEVKDNAQRNAALKRAKYVTRSIRWWVGFTYTFQLAMAITSLIALGLTAALDPNDTDGVVATTVKFAVNGATSVIKGAVGLVEDLTTFDVSGYIPFSSFIYHQEIWASTHTAIFNYGLFIIIAIFLQYSLAGLKPMSGEATGEKIMVVALALIGYGMPFLNLFPWFYLWTRVVKKHPI